MTVLPGNAAAVTSLRGKAAAVAMAVLTHATFLFAVGSMAVALATGLQRGRGTVPGWLAPLVTTLLVLQFFVSAFNEDYQISEEIRNGLINQFLLKPINYYLYRLSIFGAARLVSERRWHPSQQLDWKGSRGEQLIMTLELSSFEEIRRWILSWGTQVEVLSPPDLRKEIQKEAKGLSALYRK
jgi:hypothetical protein